MTRSNMLSMLAFFEISLAFYRKLSDYRRRDLRQSYKLCIGNAAAKRMHFETYRKQYGVLYLQGGSK